ncbi:MAG: hypothetical protein FWD05_08255 [Oscillospiraceae bacterium]|nr:hypothetical protein [Oscillospiraceae bacterium]
MSNKGVNVKKRSNWKFWVLVFLAVMLAGLLLMIFFLCIDEWIITVFIPLAIGALSSAFVALFFTIKTDKERLYDRLSSEIDSVIENSIRLQEELYTISYAPFYPIGVKKEKDAYTFLWN